MNDIEFIIDYEHCKRIACCSFNSEKSICLLLNNTQDRDHYSYFSQHSCNIYIFNPQVKIK